MIKCTLEPLHLADVGLGVDVHGTIKNHPPYSLRKHLGIKGTDLGAIGGAKIVDLGITHEVSQQIEITHRLHRRDVFQQCTGPLQAGSHERDLLIDHGLQLTGVIG